MPFPQGPGVPARLRGAERARPDPALRLRPNGGGQMWAFRLYRVQGERQPRARQMRHQVIGRRQPERQIASRKPDGRRLRQASRLRCTDRADRVIGALPGESRQTGRLCIQPQYFRGIQAHRIRGLAQIAGQAAPFPAGQCITRGPSDECAHDGSRSAPASHWHPFNEGHVRCANFARISGGSTKPSAFESPWHATLMVGISKLRR